MLPLGRRTVVLACALGICWSAESAGQRGDRVEPPWADPEAMFEAMFGEEGEVDAKTLAEIEVFPREERQIGKQAVEAYLNRLQAQGLRVVRRGEDVEYLRSLVDKLHPLMSQRERYPEIEIALVLPDRCDARCFPGGYLVFFRGMLDLPENEAALIGSACKGRTRGTISSRARSGIDRAVGDVSRVRGPRRRDE